MQQIIKSNLIIINLIFSIIVENCAVICMWGGDWYDFYIVEKENDAEDNNEKCVDTVWG